jgi:hypothetical protein
VLGEQGAWNEVAVGMEVHEVASNWDMCVQNHGCIDGGLELAWPKLEHLWLVRQPKEQVDAGLAPKPVLVHISHQWYPRQLMLKKHPVDLLERGHMC